MPQCRARKVWVGPGDTDRAWRIVLERNCSDAACPAIACPQRRDNRTLTDIIHDVIDAERMEWRLYPDLYSGKVATAVIKYQGGLDESL